MISASRADQYGGVWLLHWFGKGLQIRHSVKAAGERERRSAEQPLENLERLGETGDAHAGRVIRQPGGLVLWSRETGPKPQLEPAA